MILDSGSEESMSYMGSKNDVHQAKTGVESQAGQGSIDSKAEREVFSPSRWSSFHSVGEATRMVLEPPKQRGFICSTLQEEKIDRTQGY